jgi:predicted dehydrogenase
MELNIYSTLPARRDFRIGILGSGFIVNDCHLVAYRKAGFNPVAIASRNRERAASVAKRHGIARTYDNFEQLLDDPTIEVLDIAVTPDAQLGLIKAACARKTLKGILAQKPLGMNLAQASEAVAACHAAGITLAVNQNMRYDHSVRAGATLLANGTIGEPVLATIEMRGIPHWMDWHKDLGWLTLRIMSIHHLDCFRYWFGDPESIYCSVRPDPRTKFPHRDGICTYILEYKNGLRCVGLDDTWTGPAKEGCPKDLYIKWRIEGLNGLAEGDIGWCKDPFTTPSTIRYAARGDLHFQAPVWAESWFPDAFIGTMAQLLIALESGADPAISGSDNLKTMALVEAAYQSVATGRRVRLDKVFQQAASGGNGRSEHLAELLESELAKAALDEGDTVSEALNLTPLTPRARHILALARQEAEGFNHNYIGTEHVLLGLLALGSGVACNVLLRQNVTPERVRTEVRQRMETVPDQKVIGTIPFTPRVKRVLALAAKEAKAMGHTYVGTEHLLLGLLHVEDGLAGRVLADLNVKLNQTRNEILKELDPSAGKEGTSGAA